MQLKLSRHVFSRRRIYDEQTKESRHVFTGGDVVWRWSKLAINEFETMMHHQIIMMQRQLQDMQRNFEGLQHAIRDVEYRTRGRRPEDGINIEATISVMHTRLNRLEEKLQKTEQHLEDLHYDLERGDVGQIYLTQSLLDRLVVNDNVKIELAAGERSEPNKEDDDK